MVLCAGRGARELRSPPHDLVQWGESVLVSRESLWEHGILIGVIVVVAGIGHRAPRLLGTLLAVLSVTWLRHNKNYEAGVVWAVTPTDGLVVSDFVGLGGLMVAVYLWGSWLWGWIRRR